MSGPYYNTEKHHRASGKFPAAKRLGALGQEIQASGGPPTPEQLAEVQAQQKKLTQGALWTAILLAVSVAGMALSRY